MGAAIYEFLTFIPEEP